MRGKDRHAVRVGQDGGITPACAGKSYAALCAGRQGGDHPRVCGEKRDRPSTRTSNTGSPPRVRGKVLAAMMPENRLRITPACAGKSGAFLFFLGVPEDHPRVCGEKRRVSECANYTEGSPPRVRGKDSVCNESAPLVGITPACAGKRQQHAAPRPGPRDHPRVCGEKVIAIFYPLML